MAPNVLPPPKGFEFDVAVLAPKAGVVVLVPKPEPGRQIRPPRFTVGSTKCYLPVLVLVLFPNPPNPVLGLLLAFEPNEKPVPVPNDMLAGMDARRCAIFGDKRQM